MCTMEVHAHWVVFRSIFMTGIFMVTLWVPYGKEEVCHLNTFLWQKYFAGVTRKYKHGPPVPSTLSPNPVSPCFSPADNPSGRFRRVTSCRWRWSLSRDRRSMFLETLDAKFVIDKMVPKI